MRSHEAMSALFRDRAEAGERLARELATSALRNAIVLALPRGGVPVGFTAASGLRLPLDVFIVRKLGVPYFPELAMGAIASGGVRVLNPDVLAGLPDAMAIVEDVTRKELAEVERREHLYRAGRTPLDLTGRSVIVVDDGLATGATMRAAVAALRRCGVARIIVAVPGGAPETCALLRREADALLCLHEPAYFHAVGELYDDFSQVTDVEVCTLLARAARRASDSSP